MREDLTQLSLQELIDKLVALTTRFSSERALDRDHEIIKYQIQAVQEEIQYRKQAALTPAEWA